MRTSGEATKTDFIVFDLTRPHIEPILMHFIVFYIVHVVKNILKLWHNQSCIMHIPLFMQLYVTFSILFTRRKHLYDRIISLRVWTHKTSLAMHVQSKESV